ncbi:4408_t:CDS:2, partial [Dentiscutata erythropus]
MTTTTKDREFRKKPSMVHNIISKDPDAIFTPEKDHYYLYIAWGCPWAHRTVITRALKELEDIIGLSVVDYLMDEKGWKFSTLEETPRCIPDTIFDKINSSPFKCGFAETQDTYISHIGPLFKALDNVEAILSQNKFLVRNTLTKADIRLFVDI